MQEAKGLECENIILVNFIHQQAREFKEVTQGVTLADVEAEEMRYARAKDKTDKSQDAYKFYVNFFYVAMTRAVRDLYVVENNHKHPLLEFLGLAAPRKDLDLAEQQSSLEEWQEEARKLELQGKDEQAELIRKNILKTKQTPWTPITWAELKQLKVDTLDPERFNKKAKDRLFKFALVYNDQEIINRLYELKYRKADRAEKERSSLFTHLYAPYANDHVKKVQAEIKKYGLDYRDDPYNKKLFLRLVRGVYVLNPELDVWIGEDQWMNVYDMMFTEKMTRERNARKKKAGLARVHEKRMANYEKARAKMEAERRRERERWQKQWRW